MTITDNKPTKRSLNLTFSADETTSMKETLAIFHVLESQLECIVYDDDVDHIELFEEYEADITLKYRSPYLKNLLISARKILEYLDDFAYNPEDIS